MLNWTRVQFPPPPPKGHLMNKIDEYKNKINYDVWEDVAPLKIRDRQEDPKRIEAIRKVILECSSDGGELGSTGRDRLRGELSDDCVIGQFSKCK